MSQSSRVDRVLSDLKNVFARIAGITADQVEIDVTLLELGVDSLTMIQATQTIQRTLGVKIPFRVLVEDNPNLKELAAYVESQLPAEEPQPEVAAEVSNFSSSGVVNMNSEHPSVELTIHEVAKSLSSQSSNGQKESAAPNTALSQIIAQQLGIMAEQLQLLRGGHANGKAISTPATTTAPAMAPAPHEINAPVSVESSPAIVVVDQPSSTPAQTTSESYVPYKPSRPGSAGELNPRQQQHLDELIERFCKRTNKSKQQAHDRRLILADSRTSAGFRLLWKEMLYTLVAERASGGRVRDIDGNEYVDIAMGYGALLFGHTPPSIEGLQGHFNQGIQMGLISHSVGQAAELVRELTGVERVTFCNSGTEAVMIALRLARTVTGRSKIAFFEGSYHGFFDEVLVRPSASLDGDTCMAPIAPGIPASSADNVMVLEYGDPKSLELLSKHAHELAAVLVEPVQSRRPDLQPVEFLRALSKLTRESGTALIFDEVITGFRVHPGGVQAAFGVEADLVTYGKGIGAGVPVAVVAGKAKYIDAIDGGQWNYGDKSFPRAERTYVAGTYFMHPVTMSAVCSALTQLKKSGPQLQERLNARTAELAATLNSYFERKQIPIRMVHFGSLFRFVFSEQIKLAELFFYHLLEKGVYTWEGRNCFLSTAHTDQDIDKIISAVKEAASEMRAGELIPEPISQTEAALVNVLGTEVDLSASEPRLIPTTIAQKELWILTQFGEDASRAYNESVTMHLRGPFDLLAMHRAIRKVVARHDALRITISSDGESQLVSPDISLDLSPVDLSNEDAATRDAIVAEWLAKQAQQVFDLEKGPLVHFGLARVEEQYHLLVLTLHHIITDGWSNGVLLHDIGVLYAAECQAEQNPLPPVMGFSEYAELQAREQQSEEMASAQQYWLEQFSEPVPPLELPSDRLRPPLQTYAGARQRAVIETSLLKQLRSVSGKHGSTLFVTLFAAFQLLLHRLSRQNDLVVGISAAGQPHAGDNNLVGYCTNLLPLRSQISENPSFKSYLAGVKKTVFDAYEHQIYPFGKLIRELKLARDPSRPPLVSVIFNMDTKLDDSLPIPELDVTVSSNLPPVAKFDLNLNISQTASELLLDWEYNTDLFDAQTIERWQQHFCTLLEGIVADAEQSVFMLPLLKLNELYQPVKQSTERGLIHQLFETQAARTPDAVALSFEDQTLTYTQLNERANRLAHHLRRLGVGPETLVGICMDRSIEMIVALFGILKAGGAYVPLDPEYPEQRQSFMMADAAMPILLTQSHLLASLPEERPAIVIPLDQKDLSSERISNPLSVTTEQNIAYCIYTSGSTGQPKGAMNTHAGICNRLHWMQAAYQLTGEDRVLQKTSFSFDVSVWEFFWPLITGARLVVAQPGGHRDSAYLVRTIREQGITTMHFVPSMLRVFLEEEEIATCKNLKRVICSGEALSFDLQQRFFARLPEVELHNLYGPTEAAVDVTAWACDAASNSGVVPIGKAITNTEIYILDRQMNQAPVGVAGELHIGGIQLARGYVNRPELTAERFVPHPFSREGGERLYRTGDLATFQADGNVRYLGRLDHQVKIRGYRIELGEIESVLKRHPHVKDALVSMHDDDSGEKRLVAYLIGTDEGVRDSLRDYLKESLPEYMVPSATVWLEAFPLTANGKIDRKALPAPGTSRPDMHELYVPPRTPTEEVMAAIWSNVLDVYPVGIHDNFFALGGDSIRGIQALGSAKERGLQHFQLPELFRYPTISELSQILAQKEIDRSPEFHTEPFSLISAADRDKLPPEIEDAYPLTMLQSGMFYHMTLTPEASVYHNVNSLRIRGPLNIEAMREATQHMAARQAVLRTSFDFGTYSEPLQLVHKSAHLPVEVEDLRGLSEERQTGVINDYVESELKNFFDPAKPPLIRIKLHRLNDDEFQWTLTDFHLVIDGWGVAAMISEITANYATLLNGGRLSDHESPLPVTFRDYVNLELSILRDEEVRNYLMQMLEGNTVTHLPRWPIQSQLKPELEIQSLSFAVPNEILAGLQQLVRSEAIPLSYLLLVAHLKVISLLTGQNDVTTGFVVDGRLEEPGGEKVLGLYLNTMPLRLQLSPGTWIELAQRVFAVVQSLLPHRRFPLAALQHEFGGAPLFGHTFYFIDFHNMHAMSRVGPLKLVEDTHAFNNTHFPFQGMFALDRGAASNESALRLQLEFDASQFHPQQMEAINAYYHEALRRLVADPHAQHQRESLLSATEQRTMLSEWNETSDVQKEFATVQQIFDEQADRTPDAVALVFEDRQMTYTQLKTRANQLAHYLRALGVGPETLVGICLERSVEMVVGLLGILKAGAAYVPLEPSYPQERLTLMIEEAGIRVVLTAQRFREIVSLDVVKSICLDADWDDVARESKENPAPNTVPGNLAYVIYTSGSTGRPKGVMVKHGGLAHYLGYAAASYLKEAIEGSVVSSPLSFDATLTTLLAPLLAGRSVELLADDERLMAQLAERLFAATGNKLFKLTPAHLEALQYVERPQAVGHAAHVLVLGGEQLSATLLRRWKRELLPEASFVNEYGPTETVVGCSVWWLREETELEQLAGLTAAPIGRAIANTGLYVLGAEQQLLPWPSVGELYIGGAGVARGYLNRPDLTAERFLPDPFSVAGARIYRTGDLARYRPDGTIEYLGRTDHQIKLRGFRIELGEIESVLRDHEAVKEAVVAMREDTPGDKRLVAYVITTDQNADGVNHLRSYMKAKVPEYMVPAIFVRLDALPLTANGKVDRRALPAPDGTRPGLAQDFVAPRTEIEQLLAGIWSQALGVDQVGIDDDYFALGGDSIRSVKVVAKVQERGLALSLQDLLKYQTIRELARVAITARDHAEQHETTRPFELISEDDRLKLPPDLEDAYPLTMLQAGMIFHSELNPGSGVFHNMFSYHVRVPYNPDAMRTALESIVQRHAALRTCFVLHTFSEPLQLVVPGVEVPLHVSDLHDLSLEDQEKFLHEHLKTERNRDFDLTRAPLLKIELHRRTSDSFQFTIGFHHAILDGWSLASMLAELFQSYVSLLEQDGPPAAVKPLASAYRDYVAVERRALRSEEFRRYWHEKLDGGNDGGLKQWLFHDVEVDTDASVHSIPVELAPELATRLKELARSVSVPIKSVLLAAHLKVMSVLSGYPDVITGLVSHGRPEKGDGEQLIGMFLNTIPFRQQLHPGSWTDLVKQTFQNEWEALPYRWYPLAQMQNEQGGRELFAAAFNFTHFHVARALHDNSRIEVLDSIGFERTNLPLLVNFSLGVNSSEIFFSVDVDAKRLSKKRATVIASYYLRALTAMATEPESNHARTSLLSDEERQKVLVEWNQTAAEYPSEMTLPQLFEAQVERTPEAIALIFDNERISYRELNRRANQLAHHLINLGVGPEQLVGICVERSIEMVVALLGVLKAGAAYLPLDPSYPRERLSFMISDAQPALVLTQQQRREVLAGIDVDLICVDTDWDRIAACSEESPAVDVSEESLCYAIYTSGSTGQPKGVLNLHSGAVNRFRWMWENYPFAAGEVSCQKTSLNFVDSVWEIFGSLLQGVPSVIIPDEILKDPVKLVEVLSQQEVTRITVVPSLLRMILDAGVDLQAKLPQLKYWTTSGEVLIGELVEIFRQRLPHGVLLNLYGSSEVAADVTYCEVLRENDSTAVPIGRPIANTQIYLLNSDLQPVPVGVAGELYVGGAGLSRGYHNRPELTAERFVPSPFGTVAGGRLYRTGDLARYRPDGAIEYLGRTDHQVKLRGFRIELGEVEAVLNDHDTVKAAVVLVREDSPGDPRLVAYVVTNEPSAEVINKLRSYVKAKLPDYMVPAAFVQLDEFPLTGSGKVDRQALPAPDQSRPMLEEQFVAPRNQLEESIAQMWREILALERIGIHDDFFDVGGNSLHAMQIMAKVTNMFDVYLPLYSLFDTPTIAGLAQQIELAGQAGQELQEVV
jgi:amino acid adenylation domain-containing protein